MFTKTSKDRWKSTLAPNDCLTTLDLTEWGGAPVDELVIAVVADLEEVLAGLGEAVSVVKALRPKVLRPHPKPRGTRTDPFEGELDKGGPEAGLLVVGKEVKTFELAVLGKDVRVRKAAGGRPTRSRPGRRHPRRARRRGPGRQGGFCVSAGRRLR